MMVFRSPPNSNGLAACPSPARTNPPLPPDRYFSRLAEVPSPRLGGLVVRRFHLEYQVVDLRRAGGVGGALPQHKGRHLGAVGGGAVRMNSEKTRGAALLDDVLAHLELRQGPHLFADAQVGGGGEDLRDHAGVISLLFDSLEDVDAAVAGDDVDDVGHLPRAYVGLARMSSMAMNRMQSS